MDIDKFLAEYDVDSDIWWTLSPGEMQLRFEQLRDLFDESFLLLQNIVESVSCVDELEIEKAEKWLSER